MKKEKKPQWGLLLALALLVCTVNSHRRANCVNIVKSVGRKKTRSYVKYKLGDDALRHVGDAEALVAERFALQEVSFQYRSEPEAQALWHKSVANQTIDLLRKDRLLPVPEGLDPTCSRSCPNRLTLVIDVRDAVKKLPSPQREIIELYDLYGFGYVEVAQILSLPVTTTRERRLEALGRLRILLRAYAK
ncbi:MAG: RNA polymerase sigma factor [Planctomycetes bacterium]|nr:RNA polymerase sigma factor [Planctomycetota bacterium]